MRRGKFALAGMLGLLGCTAISPNRPYTPVARATSDLLADSAYLTSQGRVTFNFEAGQLAPITSDRDVRAIERQLTSLQDHNQDGVISEPEVMGFYQSVLRWHSLVEMGRSGLRSCFNQDHIDIPPGWNDPARWRILRGNISRLRGTRRVLFTSNSTEQEAQSEQDPILEQRLAGLQDPTEVQSPPTLQNIRDFTGARGYGIRSSFDEPNLPPDVILVGDVHTSHESDDADILAYLSVSGSTVLFEGAPANWSPQQVTARLLESPSNRSHRRFIDTIVLSEERKNIRLRGMESEDLHNFSIYLLSVYGSLISIYASSAELYGYPGDDISKEIIACLGEMGALYPIYVLSLRDEQFIDTLRQELTTAPSRRPIVLFCGIDHLEDDSPLPGFLNQTRYRYVLISPPGGSNPIVGGGVDYFFDIVERGMSLLPDDVSPYHAFVDFDALLISPSTRQVDSLFRRREE